MISAAAVTAAAVYLPGAPARFGPITVGGDPHCGRAAELLGGKGLRRKDEASRLALCAVHTALGRAAGAGRVRSGPDTHTGVVVSSNLGNIATICRVATAVHGGAVRDISPLDVPNASSNVVASTIAIWFGFAGPNVMVCAGATGGLDAVAVAGLLLRAGRASRVVVVGVEPDDDAATRLHARRAVRAGTLRAAAACVLMEPVNTRPALAQIGPVRRLSAEPGERPPGPATEHGVARPADVLDTTGVIGDTYGAEGVLRLALAARLIAGGAFAQAEVSCGDEADGWRSVAVRADGQAR